MKVFISHSWNDKSLATRINEILEKDAHEVWYDIHQLVPGDDIQAVIDVYIKKSDVVVLIWSLFAFDSAGVDAEIQTAKKLGKRIIPLQKDSTPLAHHKELKGLLGIPFDDVETGMLLLQRALLMLMASDTYKEAPWFKEAFDNVVDLGGYLNYVNTYRLKGNKSDDGYKEQWAERLEELNKKNELIRKHLMPEAEDKMQTLQGIMKELEKGDTSLEKLNEWKQWCIANESFQPDLMKKLKEFIDNDIQRLHSGGTPVSALNIESVEATIQKLEHAIGQKKDEAYKDLTATIKKYGGFLMGEKTVNSIVTGYLNYVTKCPQLLRELLNEAKLSEYVAVKEAVVMLTHYLESQDHGLEMRKKNLEGYFDDAYLINHTVKLLIEADLVAKNNFSIDFVSINIVEQYVSFILNKQTKIKLDAVLAEMKKLIGIKKNEINWGQVAAVVIGIAAVGSGAGYLGGLQANQGLQANNDTGGSSTPGAENDSACWEDRMAAMSAKYGGGINFYHPIQY
ncbi:MAG TPA: toll/interleukin-1 receptor domain-containing protein [Chitinophagaceae bacterium]|nr:toll/interleukin-1 receptor domain-containing protein [Chitinophagaceae bacterium]